MQRRGQLESPKSQLQTSHPAAKGISNVNSWVGKEPARSRDACWTLPRTRYCAKVVFFLLSLDSSEKFLRWLSSSSGSTRECFTLMSTICEICWRIRGKNVSAMTKINQLTLKINSTPSLSSNCCPHQGCKANKRVQTATQMATKKKVLQVPAPLSLEVVYPFAFGTMNVD